MSGFFSSFIAEAEAEQAPLFACRDSISLTIIYLRRHPSTATIIARRQAFRAS